MGKLSGPNALSRQNDVRQFPALPSTPKDTRVRPLSSDEEKTLSEMHGNVVFSEETV